MMRGALRMRGASGAIRRHRLPLVLAQSSTIQQNHHEGTVALRQCMAGGRWEDRHELLEGCERRSECELTAGKLVEPVGKREGAVVSCCMLKRAVDVLSGESIEHRAARA